MLKKTRILMALSFFSLGLISFWFFPLQADDSNPISEILAQSNPNTPCKSINAEFATLIAKYSDLFGNKINAEELNDYQNGIWTEVWTEMKRQATARAEENDKTLILPEKMDSQSYRLAYHFLQNQLFSQAIQYGLEPSWTNLQKNSGHFPLLDTYYLNQKAIRSQDRNKRPPLRFPSLLIGLQALYNYQIYTCRYQATNHPLWEEKNQKLFGFWQQTKIIKNQIPAEFRYARQSLLKALDFYDQFFKNYQQHLEYKKVITNLKTVRKSLKEFEEANQKCLVKTHYNYQCVK
ncbi:MAG TPA: hypothetical protein PLQ36_01625 [Candidatus Gracilibacteria bacterium]|nr:hypothetical protein [Candidatus Gracilibacteria bacterium]